MVRSNTGSDRDVVRRETQSRARRIAFRVLAWLMTLLLLAVFPFSLLEVVVMWLPDETLMSLIPDFTETDLAHRTHFLSVGIVMWALLLGLVVQLRKPERRTAPMLQSLVLAFAGSVLFALTGTFGEFLVEDAVIFAPVTLLALLHPQAAKLVSKPDLNREMAALAAIAVVPWAVFAVDNIGLQITDTSSHAAMEHWAVAALVAVIVVVFGFVGSSALEGWRLTASISAVVSVIYGLHSLAFPGLASALPAFWAVAAVVWGLAFGVAIVRRSRLGR